MHGPYGVRTGLRQRGGGLLDGGARPRPRVAPLALRALGDWAFEAFAGDGLMRLELLHQVDNEASCRVAEKSGYGFAEVLPARPPWPRDGHLHVRLRAGDAR